MAKKKRQHRRSKKPRRAMSTLDRHHLCWTRRKWECNEWLRALRLYPYCVIMIPRDTLHRYIHSEMCYIPAPKPSSAKYALYQLELLEKANVLHEDDPIEKRLTLLAALFDCSDQPTADAFRKQLKIVREFNNPP